MDRVRMAVWLAVAAVAIGAGPAVWADSAVELKLSYPEGQTVYYKYNYTLDYQSDRPELIDPSTTGRGIVRILDYGEWVSGEKTVPIEVDEGETVPPGQVDVVAKVEDSESQPILSGARLGIERFPHTLENFKGREFSWRVTNGDSLSDFKADFPYYAISRPDMVADLQQLWASEAYPILPDHPVSKGDTWTGRRSVDVAYPSIGDDAILSYEARYKLKEIKEKKGKRLAILEEKRKVQFQRWIYVDPVSIVVEGEGEAKGEWEVDLDRQLVEKHEVKIRLKRPSVRTAGEKDNLDQVKASMSVVLKSELKRVGEED